MHTMSFDLPTLPGGRQEEVIIPILQMETLSFRNGKVLI